MHFDEVKAEDFTTFSRVPPPHLQMEQQAGATPASSLTASIRKRPARHSTGCGRCWPSMESPRAFLLP